MISIDRICAIFRFLPYPAKNWRWRLFALYKQTIELYQRFNGFWARVATLALLVLLASIFNTAPFGLVKVIAAIAFLVSSEALVVAWYSNLQTRIVDWFRIMFRLTSRKGITRMPLTVAMMEVADRMGLTVKEFWIMDGVNNAFSLPMLGTVVIGRPVFEKLHDKALLAVFAHELAHVKGRHNLLALVPWLVLVFQLFMWRGLPLQMLMIAGFAFYLLASIPVSWTIELLADQKAASIVGTDAMIEALKLLCANIMEEPTDSHPSPSSRIRRLQKGKISTRRFTLWMAAWLLGACASALITL